LQDTCKSQSIKKDAKLKLEKQEKRVVNYDAMISKTFLREQIQKFNKSLKIFLPQKLKKILF